MFNKNFKVGDKFILDGDSSSIGIEDYNVRVNSPAEILEVKEDYYLVNIESIDGDSNVAVAIDPYRLIVNSREFTEFYN